MESISAVSTPMTVTAVLFVFALLSLVTVIFTFPTESRTTVVWFWAIATVQVVSTTINANRKFFISIVF